MPGLACRKARLLPDIFLEALVVPRKQSLKLAYHYGHCRSLVKKSDALMLDTISMELYGFQLCSSCPPTRPGCLGRNGMVECLALLVARPGFCQIFSWRHLWCHASRA